MTNIDSLPDQILFDIFLQFPDDLLNEVIRFVCWRWNNIIHTLDFVYEHLKQRSYGLLISAGPMYYNPPIYPSVRPHPWTYVSMRQHSIEVSRVSSTFLNVFWTSCDGLLLQVDIVSRWLLKKTDVAIYYIENPTTRRRFYLPKFISPMYHSIMHSGLAYAKDYYKVAVTYSNPTDEFYNQHSVQQDCAILTVGVDNSWRHVNTDHLSNTARNALDSTPLVTQGFLHWYGHRNGRNDIIDYGLVVTLNAETETLKEFHIPQGYKERRKRYFSTGTSDLSFVVSDHDESKLLWEAWEMKPETGEWSRLAIIDLEDQRHVFNGHGVVPIGWLKYTEVMVFNIRLENRDRDSTKNFFGYDVHTRKLYPFELDHCMNHSLGHVKSLVNI